MLYIESWYIMLLKKQILTKSVGRPSGQFSLLLALYSYADFCRSKLFWSHFQSHAWNGLLVSFSNLPQTLLGTICMWHRACNTFYGKRSCGKPKNCHVGLIFPRSMKQNRRIIFLLLHLGKESSPVLFFLCFFPFRSACANFSLSK